VNSSDTHGIGPESAMHRLDPFASTIPSSLPESQIAELRQLATGLRAVLEGQQDAPALAQGNGNIVLFSGPSGPGKTLAAQALAGDLGLDIYRIDMGRIVSKYIGETEKNLSAIFATAGENKAILFFDEADVLFGKRSEVKDSHDRYANIETNYLLQRAAEYPGIVIVACDSPLPIDQAWNFPCHHSDAARS
jgi:SpoVK/Ycf46/Vps4 family AAA+-type ATPase